MASHRPENMYSNGEPDGLMGPDETVHHQPARKKRGLEPVKMTVNLTSMIDVIFQLLIYFIITATFVIGEGVLTGPNSPKAPASPARRRPRPTGRSTLSLSPLASTGSGTGSVSKGSGNPRASTNWPASSPGCNTHRKRAAVARTRPTTRLSSSPTATYGGNTWSTLSTRHCGQATPISASLRRVRVRPVQYRLSTGYRGPGAGHATPPRS